MRGFNALHLAGRGPKPRSGGAGRAMFIFSRPCEGRPLVEVSAPTARAGPTAGVRMVEIHQLVDVAGANAVPVGLAPLATVLPPIGAVLAVASGPAAPL